ncbi:MAG: RNA polymerase sigma factor [bacterium]
MEELARQIADLTEEIQRDLEQWRSGHIGSGVSNESNHSIQSLRRIEDKIDAIHDETGELVRRVPANLHDLLAELKHDVLARLASANLPEGRQGEPAKAVSKPANQSNHSTQPVAGMVESLTPQERHVFQLCFQSGHLTYQEIAERLDISAGAAKNLVNRIFQSDRKRPLFEKRYSRGSARVGVSPETRQSILKGKDPGRVETASRPP